MIIEELHKKSSFENNMNELMEKYTITDSVFSNKDGKAVENVTGYFVKENEFEDLPEAMKKFNSYEQSVRIMENKKFQTGKVYKTYESCPEGSSILDLDNMTELSK